MKNDFYDIKLKKINFYMINQINNMMMVFFIIMIILLKYFSFQMDLKNKKLFLKFII